MLLRGSEPGGPPESCPDDMFEEALKWQAGLGASVARTAKDDCLTLGLYNKTPRPTTRLEYQKAHNDRLDHMALGALMQVLVFRFGGGAVGPAALVREHLRGVKLELLKAVLAVLAVQPGVKDKFRKYEAGVTATERLGKQYRA